MDGFNIIWCTLWADFFMAQHQFNTESDRFIISVEVVSDFQFFLSGILGYEKKAYYANEEETVARIKITAEEIEKITDWIVDFNLSTRVPNGLMMPDLYLDEEKIEVATVNIYCNTISDFIAYMLKNQNLGRDKIAKWAAENFMLIYAKAYSEALQAQANKRNISS
jgi:hypothetical protein